MDSFFSTLSVVADSFTSLSNSFMWAAGDNDDVESDDDARTLIPETLPHYSTLPPLFDSPLPLSSPLLPLSTSLLIYYVVCLANLLTVLQISPLPLRVRSAPNAIE